MSDILIKGMEMPKTPLLVCIYPNGICSDEEGMTYRAVPVPPHGDLIDRDALLNSVTTKYGWFEVDNEDVKNAPAIIPAEEDKDFFTKGHLHLGYVEDGE